MDPLERVLRPIVEGQLRGFLKEHPEILTAVTWYKGKTADPAATFVGSVGKRIIRDLLSPTTRAKLAAALLELSAGAPSSDLPDGEVGPGRTTGTRAPGVATVAAPGDPRHQILQLLLARYRYRTDDQSPPTGTVEALFHAVQIGSPDQQPTAVYVEAEEYNP